MQLKLDKRLNQSIKYIQSNGKKTQFLSIETPLCTQKLNFLMQFFLKIVV